MQPPTELTLVKVVERGLTIRELYAAAPNGDVWHCTQMGDECSSWVLFKRAGQIPQTPLSFEEMVRIGQAK